VLGVAGLGIGTFGWFFFAKNLTIGSFSFASLKQWFAAIAKRNKKDKS
jgi:hypothetical protein